MSKSGYVFTAFYLLVIFVLAGCTTDPDVHPKSEPKIEPSEPAPFTMEPFQQEMSTEMRQSYELADEIILGVYAGSHEDENLGLVHYFQDFMSFDKTKRAWGPVMKVIVQKISISFLGLHQIHHNFPL